MNEQSGPGTAPASLDGRVHALEERVTALGDAIRLLARGNADGRGRGCSTAHRCRMGVQFGVDERAEHGHSDLAQACGSVGHAGRHVGWGRTVSRGVQLVDLGPGGLERRLGGPVVVAAEP